MTDIGYSASAEIGYGMTVKVEVVPGSGVFVTLGKQVDIKGGGWSVDVVDASFTEAPNKVKPKIPGMIENKPVGFEIEYVFGGEAETTINSLRGLVRNFRTVHSSGAYAEYDAFINDFDPDMPTEDKASSSVEVTLVGDFTKHAAAAPVNSVLPAISGLLAVGETLTAYPGVWTKEPTAFTYQWKNAGVNIAGATNATYVVQAGDSGDEITVAVTGTNSAGNATVASAPVVIA